MKRFFFGFIGLIVVGFVGFYFYSSVGSGSKSESDSQLVIGATIFPIADMAENVGGGHFDIVLIVPAGASPHTFEPSPSDVVALSGASHILSIGLGVDDWVSGLADSIDIPSVALTDGIDLMCDDHEGGHNDEHGHDHGDSGCDPHYWLDAGNAIVMVEQIRDIMISDDPEHESIYRDNAADYINQLTSLDSYLADTLSGSDGIVGFHDSLGYFAKAYGIDILGSFEAFPGREPSIEEIKDLHDLVKEYGVKRVYKEPQLSDASVKQFVLDLDLDIGILDPLGGVDGRDSYIQLMKFNAESITK